jgi:hypothetical protein
MARSAAVVAHPRASHPLLQPLKALCAIIGRVSCELRDDSNVGGGWAMTLLQDGELLFSRRCLDERGARYVAQSFMQDTLKAGWTEAPR